MREYEERINRFENRLDKIEAQTYNAIDRKLTSRHNRIINRLQRSYKRIGRNPDLLPHQKALLLREELGRLNIAEDDYREVFNRLYGDVDNLSMGLARDIVRLSQGETAGQVSSREEIIQYWREDSNSRLNRWGRDYESRATGLFEIAFQEKWGSKRLQGELDVLLGRTRRNARRIVHTSSYAIGTNTAKQVYDANNFELVTWVTSGLDNVCPYCSSRNMQIYNMGEVLVPSHPNCVCVLIPVEKIWLENGKFNKDWAKERRESGLQELKAAGGAQNKGLTPFEKSNGRSRPPKPIWTPEKGFARGQKPKRITKNQLRFLTLPQLKELAASRGLSDDRVRSLGKTSLAKKETWRRAIAADSRGQ